MSLTLQQAIARQEGFGIPGSRATRNHNPGNIRYGAFSATHVGGYGNEGYTVFPEDARGFAALTALLRGPLYRGLTVRAALTKYAPAADHNAPAEYIANVCIWCDCTPETIIDGLLDAPEQLKMHSTKPTGTGL